MKNHMKTLLKFLGLMGLPFILLSFGELGSVGVENLNIDRDFQSAEINKEYRLKVPDYMIETDELNDEASLQYYHALKETYVIVIDESKQELIDTYELFGGWNDSLSVAENYRDIQVESFGINMPDVNITHAGEN